MEKQWTEHSPHKCFINGSEYHLIVKFPKPPQDNKKRLKQVHFSERGNCASQKECENSDNDNNQNIYASMARMSDNDKRPSKYFSDSSQLTNCILDSGSTCHIIPQVTDFILDL